MAELISAGCSLGRWWPASAITRSFEPRMRPWISSASAGVVIGSSAPARISVGLSIRPRSLAQIASRAGHHVGVAHARIGLNLLHPALAHDLEAILDGGRRVAVGDEGLRRAAHRNAAQRLDPLGRDVELGRGDHRHDRLDPLRVAHRHVHRDRPAHRAPGDRPPTPIPSASRKATTKSLYSWTVLSPSTPEERPCAGRSIAIGLCKRPRWATWLCQLWPLEPAPWSRITLRPRERSGTTSGSVVCPA